MKTLALLALAAATLSFSNDDTPPPPRADVSKTMAVERPILDIMKAVAPAKVDLAKTGIEWHRGLEAALDKGKPILLFQLLGNLDDVYC